MNITLITRHFSWILISSILILSGCADVTSVTVDDELVGNLPKDVAYEYVASFNTYREIFTTDGVIIPKIGEIPFEKCFMHIRTDLLLITDNTDYNDDYIAFIQGSAEEMKKAYVALLSLGVRPHSNPQGW